MTQGLPEAFMRRVRLFLAVVAAAGAACIAPAQADVRLSATAGRDHFLYRDVNVDVDVSSGVNAGLYYAGYASDVIPPTAIYAASLGLQLRNLYFSVDSYLSPEAHHYTFYGGQATVGWQGGNSVLDFDGSVSLGRTLNILSEPAAGRMPLHENLLSPSFEMTFKKTFSVQLSYTFYYYQEDENAFFVAQFGEPSSLPGIVLAVSGYPSREGSLSLAWYSSEQWRLSLDADRLLFESFDVQQNSITWGVTYYLDRFWGIRGSYNLVNGDLYYATLGVQWYWHGHERGTEEKPAISYNTVP